MENLSLTCPIYMLAPGCYKEGAKSRSYGVRIKSDLHLKQKDFQETARFKELAAT